MSILQTVLPTIAAVDPQATAPYVYEWTPPPQVDPELAEANLDEEDDDVEGNGIPIIIDRSATAYEETRLSVFVGFRSFFNFSLVGEVMIVEGAVDAGGGGSTGASGATLSEGR